MNWKIAPSAAITRRSGKKTTVLSNEANEISPTVIPYAPARAVETMIAGLINDTARPASNAPIIAAMMRT